MISAAKNANKPASAWLFGRKPWHSAEYYLLAVSIVFGLAVSLLMPVGGGFDEETHLMRVWEMSALETIPNQKLGRELPFPAVYWNLSYRRQIFVRPVEPDLWQKYGTVRLGDLGYAYQGVRTRSVYSPLLLLPQAVVLRYLGRKFDWPALPVFYATRWAGLLSYLALAWLAVRLIPFGKWTLAIAASVPVAILQASTISADAISNGAALLMIAGALWSAQKPGLGWKEMLALFGMFFILFNGKLNIVPLAVLPFILLRPAQFKVRHGYWILLAVALALMMVEVFGWNLLAYGRLETAMERANPLEQVRYILSQPLTFIGTLVEDILLRGSGYFWDGLAIYGYNYWPIPAPVYWLSLAALAAAVFVEKPAISCPRRILWALFGLFTLSYLATIAAMYVTFTPVASRVIDGVQGRYFLTVWPLFWLGLSLAFSKIRFKIGARWLVGLSVLGLALYAVGMYLSYYVLCGAQYYQNGLCYLPRYKNWDPQAEFSPSLSQNLQLSQEILPECDGLTAVRIWVNAAQSSAQGKTLFTLFPSHSSQPLVEQMIANANLPSGGWYNLPVPVDWQSRGGLYRLEIRSLEPGPGLRVAYTRPGEFLPGETFENQTRIEQDILFQTGCAGGWQRLTNSVQP